MPNKSFLLFPGLFTLAFGLASCRFSGSARATQTQEALNQTATSAYATADAYATKQSKERFADDLFNLCGDLEPSTARFTELTDTAGIVWVVEIWWLPGREYLSSDKFALFLPEKEIDHYNYEASQASTMLCVLRFVTPSDSCVYNTDLAGNPTTPKTLYLYEVETMAYLVDIATLGVMDFIGWSGTREYCPITASFELGEVEAHGYYSGGKDLDTIFEWAAGFWPP